MSERAERIESFIAPFHGRDLDAHYLAFFDCFNRGLFFEAHEVLEVLWLRERGEDRAFYQGLIQLAGAFVHLQKDRGQPAAALFRLAAANLQGYPARHHRLDVADARALTERWIARVTAGSMANQPWEGRLAPKLELLE